MIKEVKSFTLIELLIALSVLSIIAYLSASSFISIRKMTEWNKKNTEIKKGIYSFIDSLDNELSSIIFISSNKRTRLRSRRVEDIGVKNNDLRFCYIEPISYYELNKRDEVVEVEYKVEYEEDSENKYRIDKKLWYLARNPDKWEDREPDIKYTILENIDFFMLRFYLKGKWYNNWDTEKMHKLPDMIEVSFSVSGKEYKECFNVNISEF